MSKITYQNKVALNENPSVADVNKVRASDMNEIKQVVNANDDDLNEILKTKNINLTVNTDYVYTTDLDYTCIKIGNVVFLSINTIAFKVGDIPNDGVFLSNLPKPSTAHIFYLEPRYAGEHFRVSINPDGQLERHWTVDPEHGDSANKQYHGSIIYFTND